MIRRALARELRIDADEECNSGDELPEQTSFQSRLHRALSSICRKCSGPARSNACRSDEQAKAYVLSYDGPGLRYSMV